MAQAVARIVAQRFIGMTLAATRRVALHVFAPGLVAFCIYGLAEHMLPRFTGRPVRNGDAADERMES